MKFGYIIIYVADVATSLEFFGKAFGLKTRFLHESGYGELETGETTLAFTTHGLGTNKSSRWLCRGRLVSSTSWYRDCPCY